VTYVRAVRARTFYVESYVPDLDEATAAVLSERLRAAVAALQRDGLPVAWVRAFALVGEDTYVWLLTAADVAHVELVNERAEVSYDHVAEVLVD
jgi:hypothetical protein